MTVAVALGRRMVSDVTAGMRATGIRSIRVRHARCARVLDGCDAVAFDDDIHGTSRRRARAVDQSHTTDEQTRESAVAFSAGRSRAGRTPCA